MLSVSPWLNAQIIQDDLKLGNMHSAHHNYQMDRRFHLYRSTIAEEDVCSFQLTFLILAWHQTRAKKKPCHEQSQARTWESVKSIFVPVQCWAHLPDTPTNKLKNWNKERVWRISSLLFCYCSFWLVHT